MTFSGKKPDTMVDTFILVLFRLCTVFFYFFILDMIDRFAHYHKSYRKLSHIQYSQMPPLSRKGKCSFLFNLTLFTFQYPDDLDKQTNKDWHIEDTDLYLYIVSTKSLTAFYFREAEKLTSAYVPNILSQWLKCGA